MDHKINLNRNRDFFWNINFFSQLILTNFLTYAFVLEKQQETFILEISHFSTLILMYALTLVLFGKKWVSGLPILIWVAKRSAQARNLIYWLVLKECLGTTDLEIGIIINALYTDSIMQC